MKKDKEYRVKKKRGWFFSGLKKVFRIFKKKPKIINLNEDGNVQSQALYIANHSGVSGPFTFELYFPKYFIPWGTYEMCGNYKQRWNYLYYDFYTKKLHYNKFKAFILATLLSTISKRLYGATGLIGTYPDIRLIKTFRNSFKVLDEKIGVLIFPEESSVGYLDIATEYLKGFISLAKMYYKKRKIDLPVYNIYYGKKARRMIIDKPFYVNKLLQEGKSEQDIANMALENAHELYNRFIKL